MLAGDKRLPLIDEIVRDSTELIRSNTDGSGFGFEMATHVLLARA